MEGTPQNREKINNTIAFFVFGFVSYVYVFGTNFAAAEDVLAGTSVTTSVAFLCDSLPYFLGCLILPMFLETVAPLQLIATIFILLSIGILPLVVPIAVEAKLAGFCFISLASGFSNAGLLSMTASYEEITSKAYISGSGFGILFALLYYTGMTTWFHVSMENTLLGIVWMPILYPLFYWLMDMKHSLLLKASNRPGVAYSPLHSLFEEEQVQLLTYKQKGRIIWLNMPLALSIYSSAFGRVFVPQAVLTSVVFPNMNFSPRGHYLYYLLAVYISQCAGMSYGLMVESLECKLPRYTEHTWIIASLNVSFTILLVCNSWLRFFDRFEIVIAIAIGVGISGGLVDDFTFAAAHGEPKSLSKGFSRAFLTMPPSAASVCAACMGMYVEPLVREHCAYVTGNATHCFTRVMIP